MRASEAAGGLWAVQTWRVGNFKNICRGDLMLGIVREVKAAD